MMIGKSDNHVELGLWADLLIVAPATANTISKMANGICDNLLTAVYLSARCPVVVAPAMDLDIMMISLLKIRYINLKEMESLLSMRKKGSWRVGCKVWVEWLSRIIL